MENIVNIRNDCLFSGFMGNESERGTNKLPKKCFGIHTLCLSHAPIHSHEPRKKRHSFLKYLSYIRKFEEHILPPVTWIEHWQSLLSRGPWMMTIVLYSWCYIDSQSLLMYLTMFRLSVLPNFNFHRRFWTKWNFSSKKFGMHTPLMISTSVSLQPSNSPIRQHFFFSDFVAAGSKVFHKHLLFNLFIVEVNSGKTRILEV